MVAESVIDLELPEVIAVSWLDSEVGAWFDVEVTGRYLDWIIFRQVPPLRKPKLPIAELDNVNDVPQAFRDCFGLLVSIDDIRRAYQNYVRRTSGFEGRWHVTR